MENFMSKLVAITKKHPEYKYFRLNWMLHDRCTYNCSYCPPTNKAGNDDWLSIDFSKEFINNLESWLDGKHKDVIVNFTGGEPTVWPKFAELVNHIKSKNWYTTISTNGSRSLAWWTEHQHKFDKISFSYHSEFAKDEEFFEKSKYLSSQKSDGEFSVKIMMNPREWARCVNMVEMFLQSDLAIRFDLRPLQQNFGLQDLNIEPYTVEQEEYMRDAYQRVKKHILKDKQLYKTNQGTKVDIGYHAIYDDKVEILDPNQLILENKVNFKGWTCNIGIDQIFVNSLGKIWGGTCLQGTPLGNIQRPNKINWPTEPTVCETVHCGCYTDITLEKYSKEYPIHFKGKSRLI